MVSSYQIRRVLSALLLASLGLSGVNYSKDNTKQNENNFAIARTQESRLETLTEEKFPLDMLLLNNIKTKIEISEACLTHYKTKAEAGGIVYQEEYSNDGKHTQRIGFIQTRNTIMDDSTARIAIETGITPDLDTLEKELFTKHATGRCSKYTTDGNWRERIDMIRTAILIARDNLDKNSMEYLRIAKDIDEINRSTYPGKTEEVKLESRQIEIGSFHTHPYLGGFSPVDHCIFDNSDIKHYTIGCDFKNKSYKIFRLKNRSDVIVAKGYFTK